MIVQVRKNPWFFKLLIFALGLALGSFFYYRLLYLPSQALFHELEADYGLLQNQLSASAPAAPAAGYPETAELPVLLDQYQEEFTRRGVRVEGLNLERFDSSGDSQGNSQPRSYALVRFTLQGSWQEITAGLIALENSYSYLKPIELKLDKTGGQGVLQILVRPSP